MYHTLYVLHTVLSLLYMRVHTFRTDTTASAGSLSHRAENSWSAYRERGRERERYIEREGERERGRRRGREDKG